MPSCRRDLREVKQEQPSAKEGKVEVVLRDIVAEVDASSLSAINFEMGLVQKSGGETGVVPKFKGFGDNARVLPDGRIMVKVRTVIASPSNSDRLCSDLEWEFKPGYTVGGVTHKPTLELKEGRFRDYYISYKEGLKDWYISGIIGGSPRGIHSPQIDIMPRRELTGVNDANPIGGQFELEVPFGFAWTPVAIQKYRGADPLFPNEPHITLHVTTPGGGVDPNARVKFKPLGAVIGIQLGNKINSGALKVKSFSINSDAFTQSGYFDFRSPVSGQYPDWVPAGGCASGVIDYTVANATPIGTIEYGKRSAYRYYIWVMPTEGTEKAHTTILVDGDMVGGGSVVKHFAYWTTDYQPKGTGRPKMHHAHTLKANVDASMSMPLQNVTTGNLTGGSPPLAYPSNYMSSSLSFDLNGHYYNWYVLTGTHHPTYNPDTKSLKDYSISGEKLSDKYYLPSIEDWGTALLPQGAQMVFGHSGVGYLPEKEYVHFGGPTSPLRYVAKCYFDDNGEHFYKGDVAYALRFVKPDAGTESETSTVYDYSTGGTREVCYTPLPDNRFATAYKYTYPQRVTLTVPYPQPAPITVEAVYLGEEGYNALSSKDAYGVRDMWSSFPSHRIVSRILPDRGAMFSPNPSNPFNNQYNYPTRATAIGGYHLTDGSAVWTFLSGYTSSQGASKGAGASVRLFKY